MKLTNIIFTPKLNFRSSCKQISNVAPMYLIIPEKTYHSDTFIKNPNPEDNLEIIIKNKKVCYIPIKDKSTPTSTPEDSINLLAVELLSNANRKKIAKSLKNDDDKYFQKLDWIENILDQYIENLGQDSTKTAVLQDAKACYMCKLVKDSRPDLFQQLSTLLSALTKHQITEFQITKLANFCCSNDPKEYEEIIREINNNRDLSPKTKKLLVSLLLGFAEKNLEKASLQRKITRIELLKEAQNSRTLANKMKKYIDIDEQVATLQNSIEQAIQTIPVSQDAVNQMMKGFFANNNPELEKTLQDANFAQFGKNGLPLAYSRKSFINDLNNILKNLPKEQRIEILDKLNITLTSDATGYDGIINLSDLSIDGVEGKVLSIATKFIKENKIATGDEKLDEALNSLIQGMPEFINIIGKKQHNGQDHSLDIHILNVLKEAISNPEYQNLSNQDKICLKFTAIFHDIAKAEKTDKEHAKLCALYARDILSKIALPYEIKDRIYELVKNHHWLANYNQATTSTNNTAVLFRRAGDLKIAQIIAEADLKGVKADGSFYNKHKDALKNEKQLPIQKALNKINSTGQIFLTTKIINPNKIPTIEHNGREYRVINFTQLPKNTDLSQFGFEPGATVENFRFWMHMVNRLNIKRNLETIQILKNPEHEGFLCASYGSIKNHPTYKNLKYGVCLEAEQVNIGNASIKNQGSGDKKDFLNFRKIITSSPHRNSIPAFIKDALQLSDEEYMQLFSQMQNFKYSSQLDNIAEIKIGEKTFTGPQVKEVILKANDLLLSDQHNEANLYSPKINAAIAKACSLNEVPQEFLDFAYKYKLPIYLIGE